MANPIQHHYDFEILFDVADGNPNGDPDGANEPRTDAETRQGLVTDVCIKRKIRDYVDMMYGDGKPNRIYVRQGRALAAAEREGLGEVAGRDMDPADKDFAKELKALKKDDPTLDRRIRDYMCSQYFDIRTFGAVMTTFTKGSLACGGVKGPVQLGFARSVDPISIQTITVTRVAATTEADQMEKGRTMGDRKIVPYGLYVMKGHISANLAQHVTGFSEDDLRLLWEAIMNMFADDHAAARGEMNVRRLYVFEHSSALGNAPACRLFDRIHVERRPDVAVARRFDDYEISVDTSGMPDGVTAYEMCEHAI